MGLLFRFTALLISLFLKSKGLVLAKLDLSQQILRLLPEPIKHRLDVLVLIHVNLVSILSKLVTDLVNFFAQVIVEQRLRDGR